MLRTFKIASLLAAMVGASAAQAVTFNFEDQIAGNKGASFAMTKGGLTVTISRADGTPVELAQSGSLPASWGKVALSPFLNTDGSPFLLTFSKAISSIEVDVGDFAPSDADAWSLTAGSSTVSGNQSGSVGFPQFATLALSGVNSFTAVLSGGSAAYPQSVFWDNLKVQTVNAPIPEPETYALMALGLAGVALVARRQRKA